MCLLVFYLHCGDLGIEPIINVSLTVLAIEFNVICPLPIAQQQRFRLWSTNEAHPRWRINPLLKMWRSQSENLHTSILPHQQYKFNLIKLIISTTFSANYSKKTCCFFSPEWLERRWEPQKGEDQEVLLPGDFHLRPCHSECWQRRSVHRCLLSGKCQHSKTVRQEVVSNVYLMLLSDIGFVSTFTALLLAPTHCNA